MRSHITIQKNVRERTKKTAKASTLAAQYRLNVQATRTSPSPKVLRPSKHDMVQLVRDEMEAQGLVDPAEKEGKLTHEHKEVKLLDLDYSDFSDDEEEEDDLDAYFGNCRKEKACQRLYREACAKMKIMQLSNFHKAVGTEEATVIGVTMRSKDTKACAIALSRDCEVEKIRFHGNNLCGIGAVYLADVIAQNEYLVDVSITENNIGAQGAEAICRALKNNNYIRKLDLSGNSLTEDDAIFFKEMLDENHALRELHLRHNKFQEKGGEIFAEGLAVNDFLKVLDLSWNHLRLKGATAIGRALQQNRHLETLNISWNGFHLTGAATISVALMKNSSLLELDLSCNRLTDTCAHCLIQGLEQNSTLKIIRLGKNQMYPSSAQKLIECINNSSSAVQLLDLGDQCVYDTFVTLYKEMQKTRNPFKAIYGYVWDTKRQGISHSDITEEDKDLLEEDPLLVLFEYARLQNFRLLDMFTILDADKSGSLDKQEFKDGLEQVKIPMADRSLDYLIKKMDKDGDGEIDFGELMLAQKLHREKLREFMKDDVALEDTEIGRIDRKLRMVMSKRHLMKKTPTQTKGSNLLKILSKAALGKKKEDGGDAENDEPPKSLAEKIKESMSNPTGGAPKLANLMGFLPDIKKKTPLVAMATQLNKTDIETDTATEKL